MKIYKRRNYWILYIKSSLWERNTITYLDMCCRFASRLPMIPHCSKMIYYIVIIVNDFVSSLARWDNDLTMEDIDIIRQHATNPAWARAIIRQWYVNLSCESSFGLKSKMFIVILFLLYSLCQNNTVSFFWNFHKIDMK